jgi:hypothetical protein
VTRKEALTRYDRIRYNLLNSDDKAAVDVAFEALREREGKDTNVPTNADHIRSMTDEELAEFFAPKVICCACPSRNLCDKSVDEDCNQIFEEWLKQPYKEDT